MIQNSVFLESKIAHFMWAILFFATLFASIAFMHSHVLIGSISIFSCILIYLIYAGDTAIHRYRHAMVLVFLLFFYAYALSDFKARSVALSMQVIACFFLFCTLFELNSNKLRENPVSTISKYHKIIFWVLVLVAMAQAFSLITAYIQKPVRAAGMFLDYSQASLFLLLLFGLTISQIKKDLWVFLFCLILFTGFFTTFSRTANFLLVLFLLMMGYFTVRESRDYKKLLLIIGAIGIALLLVYAYPQFVGEKTVSRGGFSHYSSLNSRLYYWELAVNAIKLNPLWGHGLGNFEYMGAKERFPYQLITFAHNDYLHIWVELGLFWIGLLVVSLIWLLLKHRPVDFLLKLTQRDEEIYLAWCLLACCALYMTMNFIVSAMPFQVLFAIILARLLQNDPA